MLQHASFLKVLTFPTLSTRLATTNDVTITSPDATTANGYNLANTIYTLHKGQQHSIILTASGFTSLQTLSVHHELTSSR